jgi:DNA-binding LacI/PurR family transcriptional regulator
MRSQRENEALQIEAAMKKPVRLSDVAREAGISLGTASNAFNRPDLVRPELRERIQSAARELGYSGPDPVGRLLMGAKAHAIGVLPPGDIPVSHAVGSPYFREFMRGIAEVCDQNDASLLVVSGAKERKKWAIRNALVDGFILGHVEEIELVFARQRKAPFVVIDMDGGPEFHSVRVDGRDGARRAAEHLISLGHRRFAIASVLRKPTEAVWHAPAKCERRLVSGFPIDAEKLLGYADALASAGMSIADVPIVEFHLVSPNVEEGARTLLDRCPDSTAILAMSDRQAIAILAEAKRRRVDVPRDLSVIGFDDAENAVFADPPLTTIAQPTVEKGRIAARLVFENASPSQVVLPARLVVRASTAPPRAL